MNKDILSGMWKQIRGTVKTHWGKLTDDDMDQINGQTDKLIGKLQEKYGYSREQAEKEVNQFVKQSGGSMGGGMGGRV